MIKRSLLVMIFLVSHVWAQTMITKVIPLQYVQADKVVQLIKPLLQADEKISGSGQTLVVNVSPQTLTQIRNVLHQIDIPPVTFTISIYQGDPNWASSQNSNDVIYSTQSRTEIQRSQSVQVMSGQSALVNTDQEVPVVSAVGIGFETGIAYQQHHVQTGLLVKPVLKGSSVQLTVQRIREQVNPAGGQQFDNQQINTTMMVPLNKWVALGSAEGAAQADPNTVSYSAGRSFSRNSTVYIKVSIVNQVPSGATK